MLESVNKQIRLDCSEESDSDSFPRWGPSAGTPGDFFQDVDQTGEDVSRQLSTLCTTGIKGRAKEEKVKELRQKIS